MRGHAPHLSHRPTVAFTLALSPHSILPSPSLPAGLARFGGRPAEPGDRPAWPGGHPTLPGLSKAAATQGAESSAKLHVPQRGVRWAAPPGGHLFVLMQLC